MFLNALFSYVFAYHGFPRSIISDHNLRFTSNEYQEMANRLNTKLRMSSSNHPRTDGQTERINQTLKRLLKSYAGNNHRTWDKFLPQIEFVFNLTPNRVIHAAPFEVDLGNIPNEPILMANHIVKARYTPTQKLATHLKAITLRAKYFSTRKPNEYGTSPQ